MEHFLLGRCFIYETENKKGKGINRQQKCKKERDIWRDNGNENTMDRRRETDQLRIDQVMPRSPCVWVALLRVVM